MNKEEFEKFKFRVHTFLEIMENHKSQLPLDLMTGPAVLAGACAIYLHFGVSVAEMHEALDKIYPYMNSIRKKKLN